MRGSISLWHGVARAGLEIILLGPDGHPLKLINGLATLTRESVTRPVARPGNAA